MVSNNPKAILISDVHYNLKNIELADSCIRQAMTKASELTWDDYTPEGKVIRIGVPLIIAGDLHDSKANLRGECVNRMISTFKELKVDTWCLVGNHDRINEKSYEHSLNFLSPYLYIVTKLIKSDGVWLLPYYHDLNELRKDLELIPKSEIIVMHQGVQGSASGEYIQDKTAIPQEWVAGRRIISGHYHKRQDIQLPEGGLWSYIGNPYTQNFAEANDLEKGFQILMDDGSLEFVPTNVRKHVVIEHDVADLNKTYTFGAVMPSVKSNIIKEEDLVWVKVKGTKTELLNINKEFISKKYNITQSFKLDLIVTDLPPQASKKSNLSKPELLDSIIDSLAIDSDRKSTIKDLWKTKV